VLILAGTIFGRVRLIALGALGGAVWALLFASAFGIASLRYAEANTTAASSYSLLAVVFMVIAGVHYAMNPLSWPHRRGTN
jgi:hypothetical protein